MKNLKSLIFSLLVIFIFAFAVENNYSDIRLEIKSQITFYEEKLNKLKQQLLKAKDKVEARKILKKIEIIYDKIQKLEKKLRFYEEKDFISG